LPFESELNDIAKYNERIMFQAAAVVEEEAKKGPKRKLTSLEHSRVVMKFMRMNEHPEEFIMQNRYLPKPADWCD
jgi:hypothetical protein